MQRVFKNLPILLLIAFPCLWGCVDGGTSQPRDGQGPPVGGETDSRPPVTGEDEETNPDSTLTPGGDATTYRVTSLTLEKPALKVLGGFVNINDRVNALVAENLAEDVNAPDGPPDGFLDISFLATFLPFDVDVPGGEVDLGTANCTHPADTTQCSPKDGEPMTETNFTNMDGECLGILGDSVRDERGVVLPEGPCFVTDEATLDLQLGRIPVLLEHAQVAADYDGDSPTRLVRGLIRGFMTEEAAGSTVLPDDLPAPAGGKRLNEILDRKAKREGPDGSQGWWFYLNFEADSVPFSG